MVRPLLAVIAMTVLAAPAVDAAPLCDTGVIEIHAESGARAFSIEIANTPTEQARGLMFRPAMPEDAGMLFIFDPPRRASFWMQNTMIPLDMIFIDDTGRVESIAERNDTYSRRASSSAGDVRAVLEINGGLSRQLGIVPGTQVVHEAFKSAPDGFACPN